MWGHPRRPSRAVLDDPLAGATVADDPLLFKVTDRPDRGGSEKRARYVHDQWR